MPVSVPFRGLWFLNVMLNIIQHPVDRSFRPLSGFMVSQSSFLTRKPRPSVCFRPLSGFMVSQFKMARPLRTRHGQVSVPFRGLWFLNLTFLTFLSSPKTRFPSPFGVYGFSIFRKTRVMRVFYWVSVPFRGLWFLNHN